MRKQIKTLEQLKDARMLYEKKLPPFGYFLLLIVTALMLVVLLWSIKAKKVDLVISPGVVESENKTYVMSPYSGKIVDIRIKEGSIVEKGDPLFHVTSTDLDVQMVQLKQQEETYQNTISQYEKLVKSIKDDKNYFDAARSEDTMYYSQFEAYQSQMEQSLVDTAAFQLYGYTEEQIESELEKNQAKVAEIHYTAIQTAERSMQEAKTQLEAIQAQLQALASGQADYTVRAGASGIVHMLSDYQEGMVVQAAAAVASVAAEQDEYRIIAYASTADAARIELGDAVDIEVAGLTQSIYGTLKGEVTKIDSDMTTAEGTNKNENNSYFKIYIRPENTYLVSREGNKVNLSNGMAVETRIQYDEVTYFYYVMEVLGVFAR